MTNTQTFVFTSFLWFVIGFSILIPMNIRLRRVEEICTKRRRAVEALDSIVRNLNDPVSIEADMEASARHREMRDANRTTAPRADAGPPAVVHRPAKLRSTPKKS